MKSAGIGELVYATDCPGLALRNLTAANSGGDAISVSSSPAAYVPLAPCSSQPCVQPLLTRTVRALLGSGLCSAAWLRTQAV